MDHLLDELLADILRRLPPRCIAACRTVCKGWRAAVDDGGMLLGVAPLVPRPMRGIFVNFCRQERPDFFSRGPTANPSITVDAYALDFMCRVCHDSPWEAILDHRNGLLLYKGGTKMYVCNPATCRWAELPRHLPPFWGVAYLVFNPVVSLHYDVLVFQKPPYHKGKIDTGVLVEWPPSVYMVQVYSSRTNQWEEWPFIREGDVTMVTMCLDQPLGPKRYAVYWGGILYLHCCSGLIIRLSLDKKTYLVIEAPEVLPMPSTYGYYIDSEPRVYLRKSEQGVYYTTIYQCQLRVWVLLESSKSRPMPEWVLKHHSHLAPSVLRLSNPRPMPEWVLKHHSHLAPSVLRLSNRQYREGEKTDNSCIRGDCDWEFIGGIVHDSEEQEEGEVSEGQRNYYVNSRIDLLGYHPYKDIAFLGISKSDGFAYYLGTSKLRYLGSIYPMESHCSQVPTTNEAFIYTPCKNDLLPSHEESFEDLFEESLIYMYYQNDALDG